MFGLCHAVATRYLVVSVRYLVVFVHYLGVSVRCCVVFVYCRLVSIHYLKVKPLFSTAQADLSIVESMCLALFLQYCARRNTGWFHSSLRESVALCSVAMKKWGEEEEGGGEN